MSIATQRRVLQHTEQTGSARMLLMVLALYANDKKGETAWPKQGKLAAEVGVSERQLRNLLKKCEEAGELVYTDGRGRGCSATYLVTTGLKKEEMSFRFSEHLEMPEEEAKALAEKQWRARHEDDKTGNLASKTGNRAQEKNRKSGAENRKSSAQKPEIQRLFPLPPDDNISNPPTPISAIDRDRQERVRAQVLSIAHPPPPFAPGSAYCPAYDWRPYLAEPSDPLELSYAEGDWQHQFAQAAYKHFDAVGVLSPRLRRKAQRDPPGLMDDWATVFRRLAEIDGYDPFGEIQPAMAWLFTPGNRWIEEGMICSAGSLRKKTRTGDRTKFDVILKQAQADERAKRKKKRRPLTDDESERLRQFAREVASAA